jgi:hypothetical protein
MTSNFQQIKLLYLSLLVAQLIFAVVILMTTGIPRHFGKLAPDDLYLLLGILLSFGSIFTANWINHQRKGLVNRMDALPEKLMHYRSLVIIRSALVEGANIMTLTFALLTGQGFFYIIFVAGFLAFLYFRPSKREFSEDYDISPTDMKGV